MISAAVSNGWSSTWAAIAGSSGATRAWTGSWRASDVAPNQVRALDPIGVQRVPRDTARGSRSGLIP